MHVCIVLGVVFSTLWLPCAASAQDLTEREAVTLFLTRSAYAQEFRAGTAVVEAQTHSWRVWPNPQAGFEHEGAGLTQITRVQQGLPINGRLGLLRQAGNSAVRVAEAQAEFNLWGLCSDMRLAFYDLLLAQQREEALSDSIPQLQEVVRVLSEREKHGEGSRFDRLRAEQEQSDLKAEIVSTQALIAQARSRLASYVPGNAESGSIRAQGELEMTDALPPFAYLLQLAFENRQDYKAEKHRHEQFQWEEQAANRLRIPDPVIFAGFKRANEPGGTRYGPYLGISISIPVFEHGQNRVAELEAEMRRSSYRQEVLDGQIQSQVRGIYEELEMRRQAAADYRLQLERQSTELDRIATLAYQEGELGILELLDSYRIRRQSVLRLLELTAMTKQAEINLEGAIGKPVLNPEVLP